MYSGNDDYKILQPDEKIGRKSSVLANRINIRVKKNFSNVEIVESILKNFDESIEINYPLLKREESLTFNQKLITIKKQNTNINIQKIIEAEEPLLRTFTVNYSGDKSPEQFCSELLNEVKAIEIAEPIMLPKLLQFYPNDPISTQQTVLTNSKIFEAWEFAQGDSNMIIGISDNGVFQGHEDLRNSIAKNWADPLNGVDDDGNGYIDDFAGFDITGENNPPDNTYNTNDHGTNVAGIAVATTNNLIGMAGISFKCRFFPIKIGIKNSDEMVAPYESIIYAAKRGFKVLNCSWGIEKPFSDLDQSAINYAVANDVAVVAAAGNKYGSLEDNYPSAYNGVMAVAEVNQFDIFSGNNIGAFVDILAQGRGNWYPKNDNGYANSWSGSSYSAPVVSGIVALVRVKYPELSNLQAIELVRQSVDDVSQLSGNAEWKDILPGRVNALEAVTTEPFSIPSVRPKKVTYRSTEGVESSRFGISDTVRMSIDAFNYLGAANNLTFKLSAVWDPTTSIKVVDSSVFIPSIARESDVKIEEFKFLIAKENSEKMFFRCEITGENNYHDFFLVEYIPSPITTTFKNNVITFSVSDRGTIGFGGTEYNKQGVGFVYKDKGNQIWKACFVASDFSGKFVSSTNWDRENRGDNDFKTIKAFVPPDIHKGIFNDDYADFSKKLGIEVKQEFIVPDSDFSIAKIKIEVTNTSSSDIVDFTSGYYFDWDVYDLDSNSVELLTNAIPNGIDERYSAVELVYFANRSFPVFGNGIITYEQNTEVQSSGNNRNFYLENERKQVMNSGTSIQDFGVFDARTFSGMKFHGAFSSGEKRTYSICFGGAEDKEEFISKMKIALDSTFSPVEDFKIPGLNVKIFPQPASDFLRCQIESNSATKFILSLHDFLGKKVYTSDKNLSGFGIIDIPIDISNLTSGTYLLSITNDTIIKTQKINIIK